MENKSIEIASLETDIKKLPGRNLSEFREFLYRCNTLYKYDPGRVGQLTQIAISLMHQRQRDSLIQNTIRASVSSSLLAIIALVFIEVQVFLSVDWIPKNTSTWLCLVFVALLTLCGIYILVNWFTERIRNKVR